MNGQVFTLDHEPCTQCTCQLGEVSCEKVPCQRACSDPSVRPGDCCSSCSDSLDERRGHSAHGDRDSARSPRGATAAPVSCSSCPDPPAASPQRPALHTLQLLLRTNMSYVQTSPMSPSGARASPSPPVGPGATPPGEPGTSQSPRPSPGPSVSLGIFTLPPASPGAPGPPPVTPEPSSSASGAYTVSREPSLPAAILTNTSALSTTGPIPSETPITLLRPRRLSPTTSRLSAALVATASPSPQQPTTGTSSEEESTG